MHIVKFIQWYIIFYQDYQNREILRSLRKRLECIISLVKNENVRERFAYL